MTTITREISTGGALFINVGGFAVGLRAVMTQHFAPQIKIPVDISLELAQRLILEPWISEEKATLDHVVRAVLSGTLKVTAYKVAGPVAFLFGGALDCADKIIMGKEVTLRTLCAGTAAGLAAKGTSLAFRSLIPYKQEFFFRETNDYMIETLYAGGEGAAVGAFSQIARNVANGNDIDSGVGQAVLMGGVTRMTEHALECARESVHIKSLEDEARYMSEREENGRRRYQDNLAYIMDLQSDCLPNDPAALNDLEVAERRLNISERSLKMRQNLRESAWNDLYQARSHYQSSKIPEPALQRDYSTPTRRLKEAAAAETALELEKMHAEVSSLKDSNNRLIEEGKKTNETLKNLQKALELYEKKKNRGSVDADTAKIEDSPSPADAAKCSSY